MRPLPWAKSSCGGEREGEELRRYCDLGPPPEDAERRHRSPGCTAASGRRRADHPGHFAARDERHRWLDLVLASGLEELGEGDTGGMDIDDDALPRSEHVLMPRVRGARPAGARRRARSAR